MVPAHGVGMSLHLAGTGKYIDRLVGGYINTEVTIGLETYIEGKLDQINN